MYFYVKYIRIIGWILIDVYNNSLRVNVFNVKGKFRLRVVDLNIELYKNIMCVFIVFFWFRFYKFMLVCFK